MRLTKKTLKGLIYMSQDYYIRNLLSIKDKNITFSKNWCEDGFKNDKKCKIINAFLSYIPKYCSKCGVIFDSNLDYEKKGFDKGSYVVFGSVCGMNSYLLLKKQRIKCKHCNHSFSCSSPIIDKHCFISNNTKLSIAKDLINKKSEKDIAISHNVSPNTVERVIDSYYQDKTLYKHNLPKVLLFDEFKSVKSADGAMSFHLWNGENGKIIDIVENRKLNSLMSYFSYFTHKARANVKYIVIDMYSPYISLIKVMFPHAKIIIDKFHLVQLISRSLNKTRTSIMKKDKKNYNKMKRYWKLILKSRDELDFSKWKKFTCFEHLMTEVDVVDYIINSNTTLKNTYLVYQDLLYAFKHKDFSLFNKALDNDYGKISEYMIISIKTLKQYKEYIKNTFDNPYNNGYIEGNNNFIKVLKRIAFGFRSFRRFKARIMICKGLIIPNKKKA